MFKTILLSLAKDGESVFDFNKSLSRIHASLYNPVQMTKKSKNEHALLDVYGITIPVINDDQKIGQIDTAAISILKKYHHIVLQNNSVRRVYGDGNCLYKAVPSALLGSESHHLLLRLLTTIEIACHRHIYDITDHQCILNDNRVVTGAMKSFQHSYRTAYLLRKFSHRFSAQCGYAERRLRISRICTHGFNMLKYS